MSAISPWVGFSVLTGLCVAGLLAPVLRQRPAALKRADYDLAVYRDQLNEIDKDVARNLIDADQAEAARAEIHRRVLATQDISPAAERSAKSKRNDQILALVLIALFIPAGAMGLYGYLGSPQLPDQPYAGRAHGDPYFILLTEAQSELATLRDHPSADGFKKVGDIYATAKHNEEAATSYEQAALLAPGDPDIWSSLGDSLVLANDGEVVPRAIAAFTHAFALNAGDARSEFYLGLAEAQKAEFKRAVAIWKHLQAKSTPDAPWSALLEQHIKTAAARGGFDPASIELAPPAQ